MNLTNVTKEEITGFIGSCIFCFLVFLALYFTYLSIMPKQEEEGVLVNFGTVNLSTGTFVPKNEASRSETPAETQPTPAEVTPPAPKPEPAPQPVVKAPPATQQTAPPITQNLEETVDIEIAKKKKLEKEKLAAEERLAKQKQLEKNRKEAEQVAKQKQIEKDRLTAEQKQKADQQRKEQLEAQRKEAERLAAAKAKADAEAAEKQQRAAIDKNVSGAFATGTSGQQGQSGTGTTGTGVQGNPQGTSTTGAMSGGGVGEFNLGGRSLRGEGLPRPAYSVQEEGRIVVDIRVDPQGNVTNADISPKGTNIDNISMRKSALEAARKAKFNAISDSNNSQLGTITYRYSLK